MPHFTDHVCSTCGMRFSKEEAHAGALVRKIVEFRTMGKNPRVIRSRTVKFICTQGCVQKDDDYTTESFRAPGNLSAGLERVRAAQRANTP